MTRLRLENVSKSFAAPDGGTVVALLDLTIEIADADFIVIVGPNGSGKSTLLNVIAGRVQPEGGAVTANVNGREKDWTRVSQRIRSQHVITIHQNPAAGTVGELSVMEHIRLATLSYFPLPFLAALPSSSRSVIRDRLAQTALRDKAGAQAVELSHGQRQLLALEMAAARSARLILMDEPTASLDRNNAAFCMKRANELQSKLGSTILLVTHDMSLAASYGNRLIVLRNGKIFADLHGEEKTRLRPEDIFHLCGYDVSVEAA